MKHRNRKGFTIIEVLIAIIMLTIGVLALASSSGAITRMMYFAQRRTDASALAQSVLDSLRYMANNTSPKCTALANGGPTATGVAKPGFTATATVASPSADTRSVVVIVNYRVANRAKSDTVSSTLLCL
jgi:type IV pilus assembly protein PilV